MHTYGLWVNSYFPTDPQTAMFDDNELREVLAAIKSVIENANCDDILFDGDINSDFCRNTKYVEIVREAFEDLDLKSIWNKFSVDFTYCSPTDTAFSTIDHFMVSHELEKSVMDA